MSQSIDAIAELRRRTVRRWLTALAVVGAICAVSAFRLQQDATRRAASPESRAGVVGR